MLGESTTALDFCAIHESRKIQFIAKYQLHTIINAILIKYALEKLWKSHAVF